MTVHLKNLYNVLQMVPALNNYIAQKKEYDPPCEITLGYNNEKKVKIVFTMYPF